VALTLAAAAAHAAWAQSERRVALVIGNSAYRNVRSLEKTLNDARAVARTLRDVGFEVIERENLDRRGMNEALTEFVERISGGGVGLFYYAGHGVQIGGSNYLIPVDVPALGNPEELRDDAIDLGRVLERLTEAKAKLDIVILDACRDNPFPQVAGRSLSGTQGLAIPAAPNGILIVYSAGVNQIALDTLGPSDSNPNGLFTRDLLPLVTEPGLRLDEAVRRIRREVSAAARSVGREQNPAIYDQTDGDFYFVPPKAGPTSAPPPNQADLHQPSEVRSATPSTSISQVTISGTSENYTVTVMGSGFGNAPPGVPCAACVTPDLRIGVAAQIGFGEWGFMGDAKTLSYQSWTDNMIVVNGLRGNPGEAISLALWNPGTQKGATWGGNIPPVPVGTPAISSVEFSGSGQNLVMVIRGIGFGSAPPGVPGLGDTHYFAFGDFRAHRNKGSSLFGAGNSSFGVWRPDPVMLNYLSWSDTEIVVKGFGGAYGLDGATVQSGDPAIITLWKSGSPSFKGPQTAWGGFLP
ncbi:MAG: caspase domain-containing protein, partial [Alphaproteobacteria bacterium]